MFRLITSVVLLIGLSVAMLAPRLPTVSVRDGVPQMAFSSNPLTETADADTRCWETGEGFYCEQLYYPQCLSGTTYCFGVCYYFAGGGFFCDQPYSLPYPWQYPYYPCGWNGYQNGGPC